MEERSDYNRAAAERRVERLTMERRAMSENKREADEKEGRPEAWELKKEFRVNACGAFPAAIAALGSAMKMDRAAFDGVRLLQELAPPLKEEPASEEPERLPIIEEPRRARGYVVGLTLFEECLSGEGRGERDASSVWAQEMEDPFEHPDLWGGGEAEVEKLKEETRAIWERKALDDSARRVGPARRGGRSVL